MRANLVTPQERRARTAEADAAKWKSAFDVVNEQNTHLRSELEAAEAALAKAAADEREACALVAEAHDGMPCRLPDVRGEDVIEHYNNGQIDASGSIAAAIRARAEAAEAAPHSYSPDYQAMGDCRVCGHQPESCTGEAARKDKP
jgi:hypothetical protein